MTRLIEVDNLSLAFRSGGGWTRVLHGVSFHVGRGEVLGIVGESGCGKSTVGLTLLGYRHNNARIDGGRVLFKGEDLLRLDRPALDRLRGNRIGFVPQNPTASIPACGWAIRLPRLRYSARCAGGGERSPTSSTSSGCRVPQNLERFPHQLSGGQQQRVCIAMALPANPISLCWTSDDRLDVTTQEQIVALLIGLRSRLNMSMLYVTHDLGLLAQLADRIGVMATISWKSRNRAGLRRAAPSLYAGPDRLGTAHRRTAGRHPAAFARLLRRQELPPGVHPRPAATWPPRAAATNLRRWPGSAITIRSPAGVGPRRTSAETGHRRRRQAPGAPTASAARYRESASPGLRSAMGPAAFRAGHSRREPRHHRRPRRDVCTGR
jgi:peptide/nickel transport system ATP-binding protein